jgi:hypothetical protein
MEHRPVEQENVTSKFIFVLRETTVINYNTRPSYVLLLGAF